MATLYAFPARKHNPATPSQKGSSKKISPKRRAKAYDIVIRNCPENLADDRVFAALCTCVAADVGEVAVLVATNVSQRAFRGWKSCIEPPTLAERERLNAIFKRLLAGEKVIAH